MNHRVLCMVWVYSSVLIGCHAGTDNDDDLVVVSSDPNAAIEARYHEGAHSITLRSRKDGETVTAEILDGHGHSMTQLASTIVDSSQTKLAALPAQTLLENWAQLAITFRLSNHAIRQLGDVLGSAGSGSNLFRQLSQQTTTLHRGLVSTRLALLQEWGSEARSHITMTPEEHTKFFAILNREAAVVAGVAKTQTPTSINTELEALLGPTRFADYTAQRKAWFAAAAGGLETDGLQ